MSFSLPVFADVGAPDVANNWISLMPSVILVAIYFETIFCEETTTTMNEKLVKNEVNETTY